MLASISPLGERARGNRWTVTVAALGTGCAIGGALLGAAAGWLGSLVLGEAARLPVVAAVCLAAAGVDLVAPDRVPTIHRQVRREWVDTYRGWVVGIGFGIQLGLGLVTIVTSAATYATIALAALTASPALGAAVGVAFGIGRAVPVLTMRSAATADDLHRALRWWTERADRARTATAIGLAAASVVAAVAAWVA